MTGSSDPVSDPDVVQLLTPEGERVEDPEYSRFVAGRDEGWLRSLYRDMVLMRRVDTEATALQRQGELGLWASLLGQEAAQVGSGRATLVQDHVFPTYREHAVAWCRGVDPVALLALYRGTTLGGWDPSRHNFHLYTIVIGAQTLHATGYAMGLQRDGAVGSGESDRDAAVLAFFGDGASAEGDVHEAFVFASVYNAPVVFFCQNNQWAISAPMERQSRVPLHRRSAGFGFPGVRVDGNDVLGVYAVTSAALERARSGGGPTLIEAFTYRMGAHTTSDDPSRYRVAAEVEMWKLKDPIERLRVHLVRSGAADDSYFADLATESEALAQRLRVECRALPEPAPVSMFDHAYAAPHAQVDADREWFTAYHASFADVEREPAGGGHR